MDVATSQDDGRVGSHYTRIRQSIVSGQAGPGTVLILTTLSTQYNVSRTPVREAIRLVQDGLVERATRGYVVRTRTPEEVLEICEARIALESSATKDPAELMDRLDAQLKVYDAHTTPATDLPDNLSLILEEHAGILDAVRRRDVGAARDRVIAHQSRTRDLRIGALPGRGGRHPRPLPLLSPPPHKGRLPYGARTHALPRPPCLTSAPGRAVHGTERS